MSLKTVLCAVLLAASATASDSSGWGGYGGGGSSGNGGGGYNRGGGQDSGAQWGAAASCPAGCQPTPTGGAPPAQPTGAGQLLVQVVSVADANGSLKYFPDKIDAPVGSIVQFQFHPKNHTITESSFAEPCKPLAANLTSPTRPGLRSGFVPVTGQEAFTPVYNVLVNDTKPIWIYCGQVNHCQKGMAMVINQNSSSPNTIEKYISNAMQLPTVSAPGAPGASTPPVAPAPAPPPANTAVAPAPAAATVSAPPSSAVPAAPATFTGAAAPPLRARTAVAAAVLMLVALVAWW